jgi:hypothetical protein
MPDFGRAGFDPAPARGVREVRRRVELQPFLETLKTSSGSYLLGK